MKSSNRAPRRTIRWVEPWIPVRTRKDRLSSGRRGQDISERRIAEGLVMISEDRSGIWLNTVKILYEHDLEGTCSL